MLEIIEQFKQAICLAGINPPREIIADGRKHRFPTSNKNNDTAGEYCLYLDNNPAGFFHDWRTGVYQTWNFNNNGPINPKMKFDYQERALNQKKLKSKEQLRVALRAKRIWEKSVLPNKGFPYLVKKMVKAYGIKQYKGCLIIPVGCDGSLTSLQFITKGGEKRFLSGGRISGCYFSIGQPIKKIAICEGYATGATIYEATNSAVAIAFNASNLSLVALHLRKKFPKIDIIIHADDDRQTPGNPGLTQARQAAILTGSLYTSPQWPKNAPDWLTDFNDLACWLKNNEVEQA